jgi:hypothetical protein
VASAPQAGVHPPVDLLADPLDKALGDGGLISRAKFGVSRHRGGDLLALVSVHRDTLCSGARDGE